MVISRRNLNVTLASWIVLGGVYTVIFGPSGLIAGIVFVLFALAMIFGAILIHRVLMRQRDRVEMKLAGNLALETTNAVKISPLEMDWNVIRQQCLDKMSNANSYSTRSVLQSFTNKKLADRNHISMQWRTDFSSPAGM